MPHIIDNQLIKLFLRDDYLYLNSVGTKKIPIISDRDLTTHKGF